MQRPITSTERELTTGNRDGIVWAAFADACEDRYPSVQGPLSGAAVGFATVLLERLLNRPSGMSIAEAAEQAVADLSAVRPSEPQVSQALKLIFVALSGEPREDFRGWFTSWTAEHGERLRAEDRARAGDEATEGERPGFSMHVRDADAWHRLVTNVYGSNNADALNLAEAWAAETERRMANGEPVAQAATRVAEELGLAEPGRLDRRWHIVEPALDIMCTHWRSGPELLQTYAAAVRDAHEERARVSDQRQAVSEARTSGMRIAPNAAHAWDNLLREMDRPDGHPSHTELHVSIAQRWAAKMDRLIGRGSGEQPLAPVDRTTGLVSVGAVASEAFSAVTKDLTPSQVADVKRGATEVVAAFWLHGPEFRTWCDASGWPGRQRSEQVTQVQQPQARAFGRPATEAPGAATVRPRTGSASPTPISSPVGR